MVIYGKHAEPVFAVVTYKYTKTNCFFTYQKGAKNIMPRQHISFLDSTNASLSIFDKLLQLPPAKAELFGINRLTYAL